MSENRRSSWRCLVSTTYKERLLHIIMFVCLFVCLVVFNATVNNISAISLWSVLLVEETGGPGENHRPVAIEMCDFILNNNKEIK